MKEATDVRLDDGCAVYLVDKPCAACGCFEVFAFDCNCGAVHSDCCYHCGGFVDYKEHLTVEASNAKYPELAPALRCHAGQKAHTHAASSQADVPDEWTSPPTVTS